MKCKTLPIITSLLSLLFISDALALKTCSNEQRNINKQNAYIITSDIFYGPVKSVKAIHTRPENKYGKTDNGTRVYQFSDCNELTEFSWKSQRVISPSDSVTFVSDGELIGSNPYHVKAVSDFSASSNSSYTNANLFYYTDSNGRIIKNEEIVLTKNRVFSDADEENKRRELSENSDDTFSISVINWNNGLINNRVGEQYGAKIAFQYNYNHLNKLESVIDSESDKPVNVFLQKIKYYYDSKGFPNETVSELYENGQLYSFDTIKCQEKDLHGNCLMTTTTTTKTKFKPEITKTTQYIYTYY